jgi:hypothetical protein
VVRDASASYVERRRVLQELDVDRRRHRQHDVGRDASEPEIAELIFSSAAVRSASSTLTSSFFS